MTEPLGGCRATPLDDHRNGVRRAIDQRAPNAVDLNLGQLRKRPANAFQNLAYQPAHRLGIEYAVPFENTIVVGEQRR